MHLHREWALSHHEGHGLASRSFEGRQPDTLRFCIGFIVLCNLLWAFNTHALQNVTLAWDANSETNLAGYKLYYGTSSRAYTNVSNLGNALSASINLLEGSTYYFAVTAVNTLGIESDYSTEVSYNIPIIQSPITVTTVGNGSVTPNVNGQLLNVGWTYTVSAVPASGHAFGGWSGDISATTAQLTFVMRSNLTLRATFRDSTRPFAAITSPSSNVRVTNSSMTISGTASDNVAVGQVVWRLGNSAFQPASGTTAWSFTPSLSAGVNIVEVKSVDSSGNESPVISRTITNIVTAPVIVTMAGSGSITPNYNGQWLEVGRSYTMTAAPATGFAFSNWSGSLANGSAQLSFVMQPGLTLRANFIDNSRPAISMSSPLAGARLTNSTVAIRGVASDNSGIARILCRVNDGPYEVADGTVNWSRLVSLGAGTNWIYVKSVDVNGLESTESTRTLIYVVTEPINVAINGRGTASPRHGQFLEVGKAYTATITPATGFIFTNWTGSITTNRTSFTFVMRSNMTLTANLTDGARPTLTIASPAAGARLTNALVTLQGRAADNLSVAQVWCSLNDGPFQLANGTTNWSAPLTLRAGRNVVAAKAVDETGKESAVVSRVLTNVVMMPIAMNMVGRGTVSPPNGRLLEIGKRYTAQATAGTGFRLTNWTGTISTNRSSFSFIMESNMTLTATFIDVAKPTIAIVYPAANARLTNGSVLVRGRAADNLNVAQVLVGLNDGPLQLAAGTTNWSIPFDLAAGPNRIRVKAIDATGWESATVTQSVTYVVMLPIIVSTSGGGTITPNLNGQRLEIGRRYAMTAVPAAGNILSNWVGTITSESAALSFVMHSNATLTAQFVANPFLAVKGTYHGLFYEDSGVEHHSSGFLKLTVTDRGSFSASLLGAGKAVPFTGQFNAGGRAQKLVPRAGLPPVNVDLQIALGAAVPDVSGILADGTWTASYLGDRSLWNTTNNPYQGRYSVVLPGQPGDSNSPAGHGYGNIFIDRAGNLVLNGRSADAQLLSQAVPVSPSGEWPLYIPLYTGKGSILSWLTLTNDTVAPLSGLLSWIKAPSTATAFYRAGFSNELSVVGSRFVGSTTNRVIDMDYGQVIATDGNLRTAVTNTIRLTSTSTILNSSTNGFKLTLDRTTGLFSGSFRVPGTLATRTFYGSLLQNRDVGFGYFLGTNQSGAIRFVPVGNPP
jgi:hypothetical protein